MARPVSAANPDRARLHPGAWQGFNAFASPNLDAATYEADCLAGRCFPRPGDTDMKRRCQESHRIKHWVELFRRFHISRYRDKYNAESRLKRFFPALYDVRPKDLTRQVIVAWFHQMGLHSTCQANNALSLLRTMFTKMEEWGLWEGDNPASRIRWFPRNSRSRFVQPEEMPKLLESIALESIPIQCFFLLCLLVGCRSGEARCMRWTDINLVQGVWSKPTTKTGKPHVVPLPPAVVAMLQSLPRRNEWVFASPQKTKDAYIEKTTTYGHWERIRARAGLGDVTIHDLRRTCASWLAISGENIAVIGRVLNHTTLANTAIYARLNVAPVKTALNKHAALLLGDQAPQAPVVPLHAVPISDELDDEQECWPG